MPILPRLWAVQSAFAAAPPRPLLQADDAAGLIALAAAQRMAQPPRPVARQSAGEAPSSWKGRGLDYAESRVYQPGDDLRDLHWRLLARTGRPYVRVHHEEQATALHLLLDLRPGMVFGTRSRTKAEQAARMLLLAASAYALAAEGASGEVSLGIWRDTVHATALGRGRSALQQLARRLQTETVAPPHAEAAPSPIPAGIEGWVGHVLRRLPSGARVVLASDGAGWDTPESDAALWALCSRAEVLLLDVRDPVEAALPPGLESGAVEFLDLAQRQTGRLQGNAWAQFAERAGRRQNARLAQWRSRGLRCIAAGVEQSDATVLQRLRALGA